MIYDTHCHLQFDEYVDIQAEIDVMNSYNVKYATLIWSDYNSTEKAIWIARKFNEFNVVAWMSHPIDVLDIKSLEEEKSKVKNQIMRNIDLIVWIGEAWFDYCHFRDNLEKEKKLQEQVFIANIEIAKEFNLPLIIHIRDAWDDGYRVLKDYKITKAIIHCYTSNLEQAQKFLVLWDDIFIWFSWIVTFKNASDIQNTASNIPLERIIIETDSPYLAPDPFRWKKNTAWLAKFVLDKIKSLRSEDPQIVEKIIFENSISLLRPNLIWKI